MDISIHGLAHLSIFQSLIFEGTNRNKHCYRRRKSPGQIILQYFMSASIRIPGSANSRLNHELPRILQLFIPEYLVLIDADAGSIRIDGRNVDREPPQQRGAVYLYQEPLLLPHLNVFENVAFGLRLRRETTSNVRERTSRMLEHLDLGGHADKKTGELSGGQHSAGRSSSTRRCYCSTSLSATSTWKPAPVCSSCLKKLPANTESQQYLSPTT